MTKNDDKDIPRTYLREYSFENAESICTNTNFSSSEKTAQNRIKNRKPSCQSAA